MPTSPVECSGISSGVNQIQSQHIYFMVVYAGIFHFALYRICLVLNFGQNRMSIILKKGKNDSIDIMICYFIFNG